MAEPFVLPPDLQMTASDGVLTLRYPGDVVIEHDLGMDELDIDVDGDLEIRLTRVAGNLRAKGILTVMGEVDGGSLHAREVILGNSEIQCSAIHSTSRHRVKCIRDENYPRS